MNALLRHVAAAILGVREFRLSSTTSFETVSCVEAYDAGREIAHRLTLRRFEDA